MNKFLKLGGIFCASALLLASLAGCGGTSETPDDPTPDKPPVIDPTPDDPIPEDPVVTYYTVSFESNGGSAVANQTVESGKTATRPEDPTKTDYYFGGWYSDAGCSDAYDFATAVTADTQLYAAWVEANGSIPANFYTDETTIHTTVYFTDGDRISKPSNPVKDGYYFVGWYTADGTAYKATTRYNGSQNFYAKWLYIYTFEAENTQLTGLDPDEDDTCSDAGNKLGQSYSGNVSGANLIGGCNCEASGGAYVTNLYYNGAFLEFEIISEEATDDALLFLRLSAEFKTMTYTKDNFSVTVNGTKISYEPFTISASEADLTSTNRTTMSDFGMGNISLKAGLNIIRLEVTNNDKQFPTGTVDAAAPMIDCIKVYTNASLTMNEYKNK